jgi:hypothetical protein
MDACVGRTTLNSSLGEGGALVATHACERWPGEEEPQSEAEGASTGTHACEREPEQGTGADRRSRSRRARGSPSRGRDSRPQGGRSEGEGG